MALVLVEVVVEVGVVDHKWLIELDCRRVSKALALELEVVALVRISEPKLDMELEDHRNNPVFLDVESVESLVHNHRNRQLHMDHNYRNENFPRVMVDDWEKIVDLF